MATEYDLIRRYKGAFSSDDCKKLVNYIDGFEKNKLLAHDTRALHEVDNKALNVTHSYDMTAYSFVAEQTMPKFKLCLDEYLKTFSILNTCKFLVYSLKVKKIPAGGGFHVWHFENGSLLSAQRQFVIQLYLNDEFDGGETEFLYQNKREKASAGDVLIFPCSFTHTHRGNPPIGGTKYLVTSWGWVQDSGSDY